MILPVRSLVPSMCVEIICLSVSKPLLDGVQPSGPLFWKFCQIGGIVPYFEQCLVIYILHCIKSWPMRFDQQSTKIYPGPFLHASSFKSFLSLLPRIPISLSNKKSSVEVILGQGAIQPLPTDWPYHAAEKFILNGPRRKRFHWWKLVPRARASVTKGSEFVSILCQTLHLVR